MLAAPPRRARLSAAALIPALAALAATDAADAAKRSSGPSLRATAARTAAFAHAGGPLTVTLTVTVAGRTRRTAARILLSRDRRRSKDDVLLPGAAALPANRRGTRRRAVTVNAALPAGTAPATRNVLACADVPSRVRERNERDNCTAARGRVTITATADPRRSSAALIAADLAAKRITPEKALAYRVFALFGDTRLPARYLGDPGAGSDHLALREAADRWGSLSKATRRALRGYLLPPPAPGSWLRGTGGASAAQYQETPDECETESYRKEWSSRSAANGRMRIHWPRDRPQAASMAADLAAAAKLAYGHHRRVMGREPLSDARSPCFHGPDGALDVYLVENVPYAEAYTIPVDKTLKTSPQCDGMASFIVMDEGYPGGHFTRRFTLAHELFHAFQNAFGYAEGCRPYSWFDEGSANWAAHATFPDDQSEHFFEWGITAPQTTLLYQDYHTWPFMLWMERTHGETSIRKTYEGFATSRSLPAIDRAIGLRRSFLDFARHAWNQKPLEPSFVVWDKLALVPQRESRPIPEEHLFLAGQKTRTANVPFQLGAVARDYRPFTITDEKVRELVFRNPLAGNADARIGAILTFRDGSTRFDDWSGKDSVRFCRDEPGQDLASLVMVYANASSNEDGDVNGTPQLELKDACPGFPWYFKVRSATLETHTDASRAGNDDHICGMIAGLPISGRETFKVGGADLPFSTEQTVRLGYGGALDGAVYVKAPGAWHRELHGCRNLFDPPVATCDVTRDDTPKPDGTWPIGFSLRADSAKAESAELTWTLLDPDPGYFDADDSVCNVSSIWKGLETERQQQLVPLKTLASTAPFTLTFEGDVQYTEDQMGRPANIAYSWTYAMTLQRVDEQGNPL